MSRKRKKSVSLPVVGRSGNVEVHIVEVEDPFEKGKKLAVTKNVNTHPLDHLLARERITADQKAAGDRFLALYEKVEIGGARAIRYDIPKVDTSHRDHSVSFDASEAQERLAEIRDLVGRRAYRLLWDVIGKRRSILELAAEQDKGVPSLRTKRALYDSLAWALEDLVSHFEVVAKGRQRRAA